MITFQQKQYRINIISALCICTIIGLTPLEVNAETIRTEEIYKFAQENDIKNLKLHKKDIDVTNSDGNTAYCLALKDKEEKIAKLLEKEGTNTKHKCVAAVLSANKTFLGMSKPTWGWIGAVVGGGAAAAAAGGGGGSGGSSSSENSGNNEPERPVALNCQNGGIQIGETCRCKEGWEGKTCNEAKQCSGFEYTACPAGYQSSVSCKEGNVIKYKCENCANGYIKQNGICYKDLQCQNGGTQQGDKCICKTGYTGDRCESDDTGSSLLTCGAHGVKVNNGCVCEKGYTGRACQYLDKDNYIFGIPGRSNDYLFSYNAFEEKTESNLELSDAEKGIYGVYSDMNASNVYSKYYKTSPQTGKIKGTISITNNGAENAYGIYAESNAYNIYHDAPTGVSRADTEGKIKIVNNGTGNVYGIYAESEAFNVYYNRHPKTNLEYLTASGNAQGIIEIENKQSGGNVYGICSDYKAYNSFLSGELYGSDKTESIIKISNWGNSSTYGIYGYSVENAYGGIGRIYIDNYGSGDIYGLYSFWTAENGTAGGMGTIAIDNHGKGNTYGIYADDDAHNGSRSSDTTNIIAINKEGLTGNTYGIYGDWSENSGKIIITNKSSDNTYGIYTNNDSAHSSVNYEKGIVAIDNYGNGDVFGVYSGANENSSNNVSYINYGMIKISNTGTGHSYGIFRNKEDHTDDNSLSNDGKIFLLNKGLGSSLGYYGSFWLSGGAKMNNNKDASIEIINQGNGVAIGTYNSNGTVTNSGDITIHNLGNGTAIGMYVTGNYGEAINKGTIIIDRENSSFINISTSVSKDGEITINETSETYKKLANTGGKAIGIYGANGAKITNSGTITINSADEAYGIYAEAGATVTNTGTITINGVSCDKTTCSGSSNYGNYIKLNGGKLFQDGKLISTESINLAAMDGDIIASATTEIATPEALSGVLKMNSNIVTSGFEKTYTTKGTIQAGNTSGLKLQSQSVMFDAVLAENGSDVNLIMKSFNDVVKNQSLAKFLQKNYATENNESLFSNIKSVESLAVLNNNLDDLMGKDMFSRFAFEDFTIMRELNFDINNKLFNNTEDYISVGGGTSSFAFSGNSRYSLTNMKSGKHSMGISVAFSDVNSDDGNNHNRRYDRMYNISMPMGYQTNGFNLVTTPRIGYSYGTYDRRGFNRQNYDGTVEKQMFALMNEARYPLQLGGWTVSPAVELNFMDYRISGHETAKEYALNIKSQDNYSIEAGVGLYVNKGTELSKSSSLSFNSGVALYHEFADPYKMKLGMQGMDGTFTLRDENRSDNRAVVRTGFEFNYDNISVAGNVMSYIDREYQTNATLDFKFGF